MSDESRRDECRGARGGTIAEMLLLSVALFLFFGAVWLRRNFAGATMDQILFHLSMPLQGASPDYVTSFLLGAVLPPILLVAILCLPSRDLLPLDLVIEVRLFGRSGKFRLFPLALKGRVVTVAAGLACLAWLAYMLFYLQVVGYAASLLDTSRLYETSYIDPKNIAVRFPEKKRNLVFVSLESMESSFLPSTAGGLFDDNYLPKLCDLAGKNLNFSHGAGIGGAEQLAGTGWSIAGLVAHTAGIPLSLPIGGNDYDKYATFLPGAVTLDDILAAEGYSLELLVGADAKFAGFDIYARTHGGTAIKDYNYYKESGAIPVDYRVWWGFEDEKLYAFAREELGRLAAAGKPFALTLLTDDTHSKDGYVCRLCKNDFPARLPNVLACADRQAADFVRWIQGEPWYENTTIVLMGDHLYMDSGFFPAGTDSDARRTLNVFINPARQAANPKNRRFSSFDAFPTVLDSLGADYDGPGLGLGRSLFKADTKTLLEELGSEALNAELRKRSKTYDRLLRGD